MLNNHRSFTMLQTVQIDHTRYPRLLRARSLQELRYAIADCLAAIAAYPEGGKAGYYADELCYLADEVKRRAMATAPRMVAV